MDRAENTITEPPLASDHLTDYDRQHLKLYARLLDAAAEHADWREVAKLVLGLDVDGDEERARRIYDAHLARARWMTTAGYRDILGDPHAR